jgi:hypothetical protein
METVESKVVILIESVANLSKITANHDVLLTKLVDDHEMRIRILEKCAIDSKKLDDVESRLRALENWRWYILGGIATAIVAFEVYTKMVH